MTNPSIEEGLILMKCRRCKGHTLFRLQICHDEDVPTYTAKAFCATCEKKEFAGEVMVRSVNEVIVEKQRIDGDCHEPEQPEDPYAENTEGDSGAA